MWQREAVQAVKHGRSLIRHVIPNVIKPLHSLWNEVIGFVFLCLAFIFEAWTVRHLKTDDLSHVLTTGLIGVVLACFGISAFLKARRITRS